jgi:hypothetical protein
VLATATSDSKAIRKHEELLSTNASTKQEQRARSRWQWQRRSQAGGGGSSVRPLLASGFCSPAAKISKPAAQKSTQQQQALTSCTLTQAPSTKHRAPSTEQAGERSSVRPLVWVSPLLASGSWLHGLWLLPRASPAANISGSAAQSRWAMGVCSVQEDHPPPRPLPPGRGAEQVV